MKKTVVQLVFVLFLMALPFVLTWCYQSYTALPEQIVIATGPHGGRYEAIAKNLATAIHGRLGVHVKLEEQTEGSLDNLRLLRDGQVDFALYQPGTQRVLGPPVEPVGSHVPAFVTNVYSEVVHWFVRSDANISTPADLKGRPVALGQKHSGDYAMSRVLLEHFGLSEKDLQPEHLTYDQIAKRFEAGTLDAAFITVGIQADILARLADEGHCELREIPHAAALTRRRVLLTPYPIPAGMYDAPPSTFPPSDVQTAALHAQLLTHADVDVDLVEEVARILLSESFLRRNQLGELFAGGQDFAVAKPEFTMHPGAASFFDPELKPLLPSDFVEGMEGMRSFIVSTMIAGFLLFRWYRSYLARRKAHWLDMCIKSLLDIERRQLDLDQKAGSNDLARLQKLLDEVTDLRQTTLRTVSAHDLGEDRAVDCFLAMCHALSDKINAKITRQRLERRFDELAEKLGSQST